jgi:hypothetical protein
MQDLCLTLKPILTVAAWKIAAKVQAHAKIRVGLRLGPLV